MNQLRPFPNLAALQEYAVNRQGEFEITKQTLYDTLTYASAGQTSLTFFQDPVGQSGKTKADTNMESAGQLPAPKNFLVESIEVLFFPGLNPATETVADPALAGEFINDVYALIQSGFLDFFIGSKSYLTDSPIGKFPPKTRMDVEAAISVNNSTAANSVQVNYAAACGRPYFINPNITLVPNQNFNVTLNWPVAVALPSGQNARIQVCLDGWLYRLSQ